MEYKLEEAPFTVRFEWQGKYRIIKLKNGEDVLRLASTYTQLLNRSDIEYIEESNYNQPIQPTAKAAADRNVRSFKEVKDEQKPTTRHRDYQG